MTSDNYAFARRTPTCYRMRTLCFPHVTVHMSNITVESTSARRATTSVLPPITLVILFTVLRCPSRLFSPQFFAEDGAVYFADAYNSGGLASIFQPIVGYLTILPRISALGASLLPLRQAPAVMSSIALVFHVLPAL